jgi:hypothetical protein
MPVVTSKVKEGTLTFGDTTPVDFSCQPTNVRLTPTTNSEDPLETLCGDTAAGTGSTTWELTGTAIQDFTDPAGFLMYCFDHVGEIVPFTWLPTADSAEWSGSVTVVALEIGGDVNTRITTDFAFPIQGTPTYTPPVIPFSVSEEEANTRRAEQEEAEETGQEPPTYNE